MGVFSESGWHLMVREAMVRKLRAFYETLLMLDDTPRRIALGMAAGLFISWTPTVGIQTLLVIPVTSLIRANRVAGVIGVYLSNPFTILPMYWIEYKLGTIVLHESLTFEEFRALISLESWTETWRTLTDVGMELLMAMFLGGLILGTVTAIIGYCVTHWLICRVRRSDAGAAVEA